MAKTDIKSSLNEKYKGILVKGSDAPKRVENIIPSSSLSFNKATGIGGVPMDGHVTQVYGKESAGKTLFCYDLIANYQKKYLDRPALLIDVEESFMGDYAESLGVDLSRLDLVDNLKLMEILGIKDRVISGEEILECMAEFVRVNEHGLIVLDSMGSLEPSAEITAGMLGAQLGRTANLFSKFYRLMSGARISSTAATVIVNQVRANPSGYGNPWQPLGGQAIKHIFSLIFEQTTSAMKDTKGNQFGIEIKVSIKKNKVSSPGKTANYKFVFGQGIIPEYEAFDLGLEKGIIKKSGGWFTLPEVETKIQGELNVVAFLQDNPDYTQELIKKLS